MQTVTDHIPFPAWGYPLHASPDVVAEQYCRRWGRYPTHIACPVGHTYTQSDEQQVWLEERDITVLEHPKVLGMWMCWHEGRE